MPDGSYKTFNIRNSEWTISRGKKYLQAIEQEEIEKDMKMRELHIHHGDNITLCELFGLYKNNIYLYVAEQTAYAKVIGLQKYLMDLLPNNEILDRVFTINNIEKYKDNIISCHMTAKRTNDVLRYLKELLEFASEREYISYELSRKLIALLKPISSDKEVEEKIKYWTNEEWEIFYKSFDEKDKWRIYFKTSYIAALRIGECIGLKWKDFDPSKKTIYIRTSVTNSGKERKTKNSSSNATVTLSTSLVNDLIKFKEDMCASDEDYIFFADGRTSKNTVRRKMNKHIVKSGVTVIPPHGLRHSCASRMINMGLSPLIVSKHLRHRSVKETLDTYSHIFPSETVGVIDKVFD